MTEAHLGIDLGTSAVKVLALDPEGRVLATAQRDYPTVSPRPGWSEQDPETWWTATAAAVAETVARCGSRIVSVGLSGQLNSFVLLDGDGRPLRSALIWLDMRAIAETEALRADPALDLAAASDNSLSAICVLPKLVWLRHHTPDVLDSTRMLLPAKDYLRYRLTGAFATDPSDAASTFLTRDGGHAWDTALVAATGLDPVCLPPIRMSAAEGGRITGVAAEATGLPLGTPVAVGAGDVTALGVGCGVVAEGRVAITLGTAGHVVSIAGARRVPRGIGLWTLAHACPGADLWLGLIMSGGLSLAWLRRMLGAGGPPPDFDTLERLAAAAEPGARGVTFLPFLEGVATPWDRPDARAALLGLSSAHDTGDIIRAVLEGVAFNAMDCLDALRRGGVTPTEIRLAEGGAQSDLWCQIIADVLGLPTVRIHERDTSSVGAALIGRSLVRGADLREISEAGVRLGRRFEPMPSSALKEALARYRAEAHRTLGLPPAGAGSALGSGHGAITGVKS